MGVWQGVTMEFLKYRYGRPCPTLLRPAGRPPAGRAACGRLFPPFSFPRHAPIPLGLITECRRQNFPLLCFEIRFVPRFQARTGRGIHGLPKVSLGAVMPNPSMPCGRATPQGGRPTAVFFPLGYPFLYGPARFRRRSRYAFCQANATVRQTMLRNNITN
jgi:hypothetical protein